MTGYLLGFDQGSTRSKAVLVDRKGRIVRQESVPLKTDRPGSGRVEQDPVDILKSQVGAAEKLLRSQKGKKIAIIGLGIANQRSTLILWDKKSGKPLVPALSWQDLRAAGTIEKWGDAGNLIRTKTGLRLTPYYSAPKLRWLLDHVRGLRGRAEKGKVLAGTVNSYLIWHLTLGDLHVTDPSNAARMLLMNLQTLSWDKDLLTLFDIPSVILPRILPTSSDFGKTRLAGIDIPILASIGDQQAALLGSGPSGNGEAMVNYGTGGFLLVDTGNKPLLIPGLLASIAWNGAKERRYLAEGTVNSVGSFFERMVAFGWIRSSGEIDQVVKSSRERVTIVPSLSGLGAPHWLAGVKTAIFGLGPETKKADLVRGAVEGVAFLVKDIAEAVGHGGKIKISRLVAGGGASRINALLQAQSDLLGIPVRRSGESEATALGAALLSGIGAGWWKSPEEFPGRGEGKRFIPEITKKVREARYREWEKALEATRLFHG